jgi:hypothetical protein
LTVFSPVGIPDQHHRQAHNPPFFRPTAGDHYNETGGRRNNEMIAEISPVAAAIGTFQTRQCIIAMSDLWG